MDNVSFIHMPFDNFSLQNKIQDLENMHTMSIVELTDAAARLDNSVLGQLNSYCDSTISFFTTIFTSLLRSITHLVLLIFQAPACFFSQQSRTLAKAFAYRLVIDLSCAFVATIGTLYPPLGRDLAVRLNEYVVATFVEGMDMYLNMCANHPNVAKLNLATSQLQLLYAYKLYLNPEVNSLKFKTPS